MSDTKNKCENCKHHSVHMACDSDGWNEWEEHVCHKRYEETEDKINEPAYRKVPKVCFEVVW